MPTMMIAMLLAAASPEAEALGRRLAETGTLATVMPLMVAKDTEELVKETPDLSPAEAERLRATARRTAEAGMARIMAAMGKAYAEALSEADLRTLVAFHEGVAARAKRAADPAVVMATMQSVGSMDFKADVRAAFCRDTGKLCAAK